jgi:HEPN domain-containing protein
MSWAVVEQLIFHAQQAAEHVIKAAMLRTCGVTGDEFRGSNGHSLRSLMQQTGLTSPVAHDALDRLSKAYLASRYAAFPPRGTPSTPFSAYSSHDADEALASASALVESGWSGAAAPSRWSRRSLRARWASKRWIRTSEHEA